MLSSIEIKPLLWLPWVRSNLLKIHWRKVFIRCRLTRNRCLRRGSLSLRKTWRGLMFTNTSIKLSYPTGTSGNLWLGQSQSGRVTRVLTFIWLRDHQLMHMLSNRSRKRYSGFLVPTRSGTWSPLTLSYLSKINSTKSRRLSRIYAISIDHPTLSSTDIYLLVSMESVSTPSRTGTGRNLAKILWKVISRKRKRRGS